MARESGEKPFVSNGTVTIFWNSRALVQNCTFTGNRNGVDGLGGGSSYVNCIFADNTLDAGLKGRPRYELAVPAGANVSGCVVWGQILDPHRHVSGTNNVLDAPAPRFGADFVPQAPEYRNAGYRPVARGNSTTATTL